MLRYTKSLLPVAAVVIAGAAAASAQDIPSLIGTWKGSGHAVHIGPTPYRAAEGSGVNFPDKAIEFTYVINEQKGNRFAGESSAGNFKETIIGALQIDNRGGIILDNDGQYLFTLRDPDTMDVCYSHNHATSKVAACFLIRRTN